MSGWKRPGPGRPPTRREEVLTEWEMVRSRVSFREFPALVGMTYTAWERMFYRAKKASDPRAARRHASDERWVA